MNVRDTVLYTVVGKGHINIITPRKPRLTDGKMHPVTITKAPTDTGVR